MTTTLPRLYSQEIELDTSPEAFDWLRDSSDIADDFPALRERMAEDGYLYVPGYLNREGVKEARAESLRRLAEEGHIDTAFPLDEAVASRETDIKFHPNLSKGNRALMQLLYAGPMMRFYEGFLGEDVLHFDYTWMRAVSPGVGTPPHLDVVYMGRGTKNLWTAWTPLSDIPLEMGGLIILENSHRNERIKNGYGTKDVDEFCENRVGAGHTDMGGGGNITAGGWLSRQPAKLRNNLRGRWLTAPEFRMGDLLTFSMYTIHGSLDNQTNRIRLSSDSRYQPASEPADERWTGPNPVGHGPGAKRALIC